MGNICLLATPKVKESAIITKAASLYEDLGKSVTIIEPKSKSEISSEITKNIELGAERIIFAGGDGLIKLGLPAMANSGVPMGILPFGSGNDFARPLGLDFTSDLKLDARHLDKFIDRTLATTKPIDLILVNVGQSDRSEYVATIITGGLTARANNLANKMNFVKGSFKYTLATALELARNSSIGVSVKSSEKNIEHRASFIAIGNTSSFGGGRLVCDRVKPNDNQMQVVVVNQMKRLKMVAYFYHRFLKPGFLTKSTNLFSHQSEVSFLTDKVKVVADCPLWADGEKLVDKNIPVDLKIVPKALEIAGAIV